MNFISRKSLNNGTFSRFKRFLAHYKTRDMKIQNFPFSVVKRNATQSTVMIVNNKRKHAHQMHANVRKRAFSHVFFDTGLRENGACVLRVRRPLISDLYCNSQSLSPLRCILNGYGQIQCWG